MVFTNQVIGLHYELKKVEESTPPDGLVLRNGNLVLTFIRETN